jgi:dienelactone hydrolase
MALSFQCSHCGRSYTTSEQWAGKQVKCKACGQAVRVPDLPAASPPEEVYDLTNDDGEGPAAAASAKPLTPRSFPTSGEPVKRPKKDSSGERSSASTNVFRGGIGALVVLALIGFRMYNAYRRGAARQARQAAPAARAPRFIPPAGVPNRVAWTMPTLPEPGPGVDLERGVRFHEVHLQGANRAGGALPGHSGKLWLYLPAGDHAPKSLPCILIAGAGSNLITGMELGDGDRPEHLPYVRAGLAVLAYELDGMMPDRRNANVGNLAPFVRSFLDAEAGLVNMRVALEYATTRVPSIDPRRLYAVGHSSAATLALLVAENEPRISACVAFMPVVDLLERFPPQLRTALPQLVPGADQFFGRFNPRMGESKIQCPLFLFYAEDDHNAQQNLDLATRLQGMKKPVTVSTVPKGGHYEPMIQPGIPRAIEWLKALPAPSR